VTFLFTDIENSTVLRDQYPDEIRQSLERHDRILHDTIAAHDRFVFSHGGEVTAVAFPRAAKAVAAAVDAQRALLGESCAAGLELRVRMGAHGRGRRAGGGDFGPPLNRVAVRV
jgi:class 3 adenylate cyclase